MEGEAYPSSALHPVYTRLCPPSPLQLPKRHRHQQENEMFEMHASIEDKRGAATAGASCSLLVPAHESHEALPWMRMRTRTRRM